MKTKLIKTVVDKAEATGSTDLWIWDTELDGFGLRVKPSGRKLYVLRYRTKAGTQRKQNIAKATEMPQDKARDLARKVLAQVAEGADPVADRKPKTADTSLGKMFEAYVASMRAKGRTSADEVERVLLKRKGHNVADAMGRNRPAGDITPMEVVNHVSKIFKGGTRAAADKTRSYIASAYSWAMKSANDYTVAERQDWGIIRNPAADVPKDGQATTARERNLSIDELSKLWRATAIGSPGFSLEVAACIRLLIACGQRVQETLRMEGKEVDLDGRVWTIPAHKTKGRKYPHAVPLPSSIIPELKVLIEVHGDGPIFPIRTASKDELMPFQSIMQAIRRWCDRTESEHFQTRDLRRTWKSRAADAGIDRFTRDLIQQHARGDTGSKHYDKADYFKQMREAMNKWDAWMATNLEKKAPLQLVA